ncbi:MAG: ATP-binding protein [Chitinophagaceae bacterium]|nr:ATP-binding protein [Chitinophagaceae bacterium]
MAFSPNLRFGKKATHVCPCGYYNHPEKECVCGAGVVQKYLNRISGPLLDRIDLHVEVTPVPFRELSNIKLSEKSDQVRERVIKARVFQEERFAEHKDVHSNAQMTTKMMRQYCLLPPAGDQLIKTAMEKLGLSARAYDRILKVSRTIADLEASEDIRVEHLAEAIQYRSLDKENWAG